MTATTPPSPDGATWPRVTVLVLVYNMERYIAEALDSVVGTGYPALELRIIDDGSKDGTVHQIRNWIRDNPGHDVVVTVHAQNHGVTRSLNEGIREARGELICLLAADDVLLPQGIAARVRYLQENPEKLAVFADCHVIDADGNQLHESGIEGLYVLSGMRKDILAFDECVAPSIVFNWGVPGPVFMCRARAYDVVGRYDETLIAEDWDMYLRLAAIGGIGFVPAYVAKYRWHPSNVSHTRRDQLILDGITTARRNLHRFGGMCALRLRAMICDYEQKKASSVATRWWAGSRSWFYEKVASLLFSCLLGLARLRRRPGA